MELAESLSKNRHVVESAVCKLRADGFPFKGMEMMVVWDMDWWSTIEKLTRWLCPLAGYVVTMFIFVTLHILGFRVLEKVQADGMTLGEALELVTDVIPHLVTVGIEVAPADKRFALTTNFGFTLFVCKAGRASHREPEVHDLHASSHIGERLRPQVIVIPIR